MNLEKKKGFYESYIKRPIDLFFSLFVLIVFSPFFLVIALLVKIKLGSPVFFKQKRPGLHERIFTMYKFRTMTDEKDENGNLLPDHLRLTKFGKLLRSTSLDELPELINIIKNEMSFIGPRPLLIKYLPYFKENERIRAVVKPGITGLAQISGRNALNWSDRFALDIDYVSHLSFKMDVFIIFKTIFAVMRKKDILVGSEHILKDLDTERG